MLRFAVAVLLSGSLAAAGLAQVTASSASAELRDAKGRSFGKAVARQSGDNLHLVVTVRGLPQGVHGAHIHAVGKCEGPEFTTAGPHWNPTMRQHGINNPNGTHKGDAPNLAIDARGRGELHMSLGGMRVAGGANELLDTDGAAFVLHADADDLRTDPSGNSGKRILCGVFKRVR